MIDHSRYREAVLADPHSTDAEVGEHRDACAECREYTERLLKFESKLERAMRVPLPARAQALPRAAPTRSWLALAASVLVGVAIVGGVWLTLPQRSLAAAVVAHMAGEPGAWRTETAVPDAALQDVLKNSKLELRPSAGVVSYASSCEFRGHRVPHLVVQTASGPVTVMVLVHEPVRRPTQFDEQGYRGTIVPVPGHGSLAVLMRDASGAGRDQVTHIAERVEDSIVWIP